MSSVAHRETQTRPDTEAAQAPAAGEVESIRLLQFEGVQLRTPTVSRLTFYEGKPPLEFIRERVAEICRMNPWLQGRLVRKDKKLFLVHPKRATGIEPFVKVVDMPALRFDSGFSELTQSLKGLVVKRGSACVDQDEDLFRVVVANISEERFALIVSVSHVISDGHTFYQLFRMLSETEPVRPLIVERVYSSGTDMHAAVRGGDDTLPWLGAPGFIVNAVGTMLRRRAPQYNLFSIDQQAVETRKSEYQAAHHPKFITSNDVVMSDFFSSTDCALVFMTVNFRGRIPNLTSDHAGNYQRLIAYQREDFARPELIRSAMADFRRAVSGDLPGFFRSTRVKMGAITNSASLYKDVLLPGCTLLSHRPVVDSEQFVPFDHALMLFKSRQDQLALITSSRDTSALSRVRVLANRIV